MNARKFVLNPANKVKVSKFIQLSHVPVIKKPQKPQKRPKD